MNPLDPVAFRNRPAQVRLAVLSGAVALIGMAMLLSDGTRVPGAIFLVVWSVVAYRALRASSVVVHPDHVALCSIVRTRRLSLAEIRAVEVIERKMTAAGLKSEYLLLQRTTGRAVAFMDFNCRPPRRPDGESAVRQAAEHINSRLSGSTST